MMFCVCECLCTAYPLEPGEVRLEFCISGWNRMRQPYMESTTALSDYEFIARNDSFWRAPEIDFHYEAEARKGDVRLQI